MVLGDVLALRVAARYLRAKSLGDPKDLLHKFAMGIALLDIPDAEITKARRVINEYLEAEKVGPHTWERKWPGYDEAESLSYSAWARATTSVEKLAQEVIDKLFLAILQDLVLPETLRKKVEQAAKIYASVGKPRRKVRGIEGNLERFDIYEKRMAQLKGHLAVAIAAIQAGKPHTEEGEGATRIKVGDFTLVNTGGFPGKIMDTIGDLVQKAQAHLKSKGFGKVCYGDIQVTNKLKTNAYAFYMIGHDEMFIRADAKASPDILKTTLHELGHRYQHVFMKGREMDISHLYYVIEGHEKGLSETKDLLPAIGDTAVDKGKTFQVTRTLPNGRGSWEVHMTTESKPGATYKSTLEGWLIMKGETARDLTEPDFKGFVTLYAKKGGPGENFAEMFAFYCLGKLPKAQVELFEGVIGR